MSDPIPLEDRPVVDVMADGRKVHAADHNFGKQAEPFSEGETARKAQIASRKAMAANRKARVDEDQKSAAAVWVNAVQSIGMAGDEDTIAATTDGIARAADLVVAASLASILSGDPQFAPQHGKEAAEMMKAAASVAREYRARLQLERLQAEVTGNKGRTGGAAGSLAGTITELVTKLEARANGETRP